MNTIHIWQIAPALGYIRLIINENTINVDQKLQKLLRQTLMTIQFGYERKSIVDLFEFLPTRGKSFVASIQCLSQDEVHFIFEQRESGWPFFARLNAIFL